MATQVQVVGTQGLQDSLEELLLIVCQKLQLSETQYVLAKGHYAALGEWLDAKDSPLHPYRPRIYPQGSVKIGTTVRPWAREEYDVDLVCELNIHWPKANPVSVLDFVQARIEANGRYAGKIERKNRCVRVTYEHDFHLDVLPAAPDGTKGGTCVVVPDCDAHSWKASNPEGYAQWFENQSQLLGSLVFKAESLPKQETAHRKAVLKRVVPLFKRFRDVYAQGRSDLATPSIVITTLAALHYSGEATVVEATANIIRRILQTVPSQGRLFVLNPTNQHEDFSEKWNELPRYLAFLGFLRQMNSMWSDLRNARGIHNVSQVLKAMFGEDVGGAAIDMYAAQINKARHAGNLSVVGAASGMISTVPSVASRPIPKHTYHGK